MSAGRDRRKRSFDLRPDCNDEADGECYSRRVSEDDAVTVPAPMLAPMAARSDAALPGVVQGIFAGRYEILGLIGMGGMGAVYRARDAALGEIVALKLLRPVLARDSQSLVQFCQEVRLARRVTHRNVARTYDLGEADGQRFLTMELVEGQTLAATLEEQRMTIARAVEIALSICSGVAAAHDAGVVHRDLKPENVAIAEDGRVVVMDFGIARGIGDATERAGIVVGTPEYMAPEQAQGVPDVDGRADQYAIGTILFEMLTGERPFSGPALTPILRRTMEPPPDPRTLRPEIPEALAKVVVRCLARARDERYPDVRSVGAELRRVRGATASVPPPRSGPRRPLRGLPTLAILPLDVIDRPELEHLGWGFSGALIDALGVAAGLVVQARALTSQVSGATTDPRASGRLLGAEVIAHGTLRASTDGIVAHVRLTTVEDGVQIWQRHFLGKRGEIERFADDAARDIMEALGVSLPKVERVLRDPEVLDLFLRGRRELFRFTADATARAQELLRLASERAPSDPIVLAAYASALGRQVGVDPERAASLGLARDVAERAHAAAPSLPEPIVAIATVALQSGDSEASARHVARALAVAPSSAEAHELAAHLFFEAGALAHGNAHMDVALNLEPRYVAVRYHAARAAALAGDWTEIERLVLGPIDHASPFSYWADRFRLSLWRGDARWIDGLDASRLEGLTPEESRLAAGAASLLRDRTPSLEARAIIEGMGGTSATARTRTLASQLRAEASGYIGDREQCIATILDATAAGLFDLPWIDHCPALAIARDAPEIAQARETVKARAAAVLDSLR